ncbi:MAG TPA: hypothetical protein VIG33_12410, partial [Pseudobdellovibrionaceae bacterium]
RWGFMDGLKGLFFMHQTVSLTEKGRKEANARPEASTWEPPPPEVPLLKPLDGDTTNYPGQ